MKTWTVKPYYTPREDSDPLGTFVVEEVRDEATRFEDASMDATPNSEEELAAIDAKHKVIWDAQRLIEAAPKLLEALESLVACLDGGSLIINPEDRRATEDDIRNAVYAIAKAKQ